jgi:hypothetical protein
MYIFFLKTKIVSIICLQLFCFGFKEWKNVQMVLGKTGHESLKRLIIEFKIETCPLEVAIGAGDFLPEYSIDQVREVSAGCATFFVWVRRFKFVCEEYIMLLK